MEEPKIRFHAHALARMEERGAEKGEVISTIKQGEKFLAKFGRHGYRRNFAFHGKWRDKIYETKQVEVFTVREESFLTVITVIVRYF